VKSLEKTATPSVLFHALFLQYMNNKVLTLETYEKKCFSSRNSSLKNNGKALPSHLPGEKNLKCLILHRNKICSKGTVSRYSDRQCYLRKDSNGCERPQQFLLVIVQCVFNTRWLMAVGYGQLPAREQWWLI
jgi:hypothetical protein